MQLLSTFLPICVLVCSVIAERPCNYSATAAERGLPRDSYSRISTPEGLMSMHLLSFIQEIKVAFLDYATSLQPDAENRTLILETGLAIREASNLKTEA
jgi:hypothetical protein